VRFHNRSTYRAGSNLRSIHTYQRRRDSAATGHDLISTSMFTTDSVSSAVIRVHSSGRDGDVFGGRTRGMMIALISKGQRKRYRPRVIIAVRLAKRRRSGCGPVTALSRHWYARVGRSTSTSPVVARHERSVTTGSTRTLRPRVGGLPLRLTDDTRSTGRRIRGYSTPGRHGSDADTRSRRRVVRRLDRLLRFAVGAVVQSRSAPENMAVHARRTGNTLKYARERRVSDACRRGRCLDDRPNRRTRFDVRRRKTVYALRLSAFVICYWLLNTYFMLVYEFLEKIRNYLRKYGRH